MKNKSVIYSFLFIILFLSACAKCENRYVYSDEYPSVSAYNYLPYVTGISFKMRKNNGDVVNYICVDRQNIIDSESGHTACRETFDNCKFTKYADCPIKRYYILQNTLKCMESDSLSMNLSIDQHEFLLDFVTNSKNKISLIGFTPETKCLNYSCLSSIKIDNQTYQDVLAVKKNDATNLLDSLYYNQTYGILKVRFSNGNTLERIP